MYDTVATDDSIADMVMSSQNCEDPGTHRVVWELLGRYCAKCIGPSCMKVYVLPRCLTCELTHISRSHRVWTKAYAHTYMQYSLHFVPDFELEQYLPNVVCRGFMQQVASLLK